MKKTIIFVVFLLFAFIINAQKGKITAKPTNTGTITNVKSVPSITMQIKNGTFINADNTPKKGRPKQRGVNSVVPNKGLPKGDDPLIQQQINATKTQGRIPSLVFDADVSQATPSDPTGAVGPNHYIAAWNSAFRIFDKSGNPLTPEASLSTIFPGNAIGDPVVLYDAAADRYLITEFDDNPNGFNVAVSQGPDPVNDGWYVYTTGFGTGSFPDYTKFSIWSDGYYVTANISATDRIFVVERDQMLNGTAAQFVGLPLPGIETSGFYSPQIFNVGNSTLPATGNATVVYMQDDAWTNVTQDHLKLWTINVDWNNTANSTISTAQQINTAAFTGVFDNGSFSNLAQPGGSSVDALQATIMNQAQFRKFATHNSVVFNFVVDVAAGTTKQAGIRWYELRQVNDSAPWTLFQEGTYTAPNNKHAWAGSMAMDNQGNIGMGYTSMGGTVNQRIAINYTGRFASDAVGTMSVAEQVIAQGSSNDPSTRYTDYTHLTIDPSDDQTFWHIAEYFNPERRDVVGVFKIAPNGNNDTGITRIDTPISGVLTNSEQVTVTIFNFGVNSQSNIPISLVLDGTTVANEVFTGTIASSGSASYTFTATVDLSTTGQTYQIVASTNLIGDEDNSNNSQTVNITNQLNLCIPEATTGCNVDGIKQFALNTINADDGASGCNTEGGSGINGYADRRNLSTDLNINTGSYTMQVQMNWSGGIGGPEKLSAWIDFNDNGNFELSEQLISGATFSAALALENFTLTIPAAANLGNHILRVRVIDTSVTPGDVDDPCADYQFGETHDYTVNIINTASCANPSNLSVSGITETSAILNWIENGTATLWNIEFGLQNFVPTGTPTNSGVTNPFTLTGLTANTAYDYYVQADCVGSLSSWIGPLTFTTFSPPITNDEIVGAITVTCNSITSGTTATATQGTDETTLCGTSVSAPGVWYSFIGTGDFVNVDICGATHDSKINIYTGTSGNLTCVVGEDDDATNCGPGLDPYVDFQSTLGETYLILVNGYNGSIGSFNLTLNCSICEFETTTWNGNSWNNGTPTLTKSAIIDGNYNTATDGNIAACTLNITINGLLEISANSFANITNSVINKGVITIFPSGSLVQIDDLSTVTGTGTFTTQISTTPLQDQNRYTYFSSPVTNETLNVFSSWANTSRMYEFNNATQFWEFSTTSTTMVPGKGFIAKGTSSLSYPITTTSQFNGPFNNGIISQTAFMDVGQQEPDATDDDSNFFGNPYPSAINADLFLTANTNIDALYFWTHASPLPTNGDNLPLADYAVWTLGTGTLGKTVNIASGQGFFGLANNNGAVVFNNALRVTSGNNDFRNQNEDKIWLNLTNTETNSFNQVAIVFSNNGSEGFDHQYDAKSIDVGFASSFYSLGSQGEPLVIQTKALFNSNTTSIPLGITINNEDYSTMKISIDHLENLNDVQVYLKDYLLDTVFNLNIGDYEFTISEIGTINNRFELILNRDSLAVEDMVTNDTLIVSNETNNSIKVRMLDGSIIKNFKAFDVIGKLIIDTDANSNEFSINTKLNNGDVLFIKVTLNNGQVLSKKFIKL